MGITDELREYVIDADGMGMTHGHAKSIYAIADRIDAEADDNERFRREAEPFCNRLREAAAERADVTLFGVDYVALPLDADGVPIHIGDVLNPPADCDDYTPLQVVRLAYDGYEDEWFFDGEAGGFCGMVGEHMDVAGWTHYHAPTVEDVLREFADEVKRCCDTQDTIAEFAAKLRLAEEVDA